MRNVCRRQKGGPNRTEPDGPRQAWHQAASARRPPRYAAGRAPERGQPARLDRAGYPARCGAARAQPCGRPRKRPHKLHADKGYAYRRCRLALRQRGIQARIARRGVDSSQRLGRHRWVVERTFAWLNRFRRLRVRYERRDDLHLAFTVLGCALITWKAVNRFC